VTERTGVIHDIGYRRYAGPRVGRRGILAALVRDGVLAVFGFGRSGRAKVLPFVLLGMTLVPAVIQVGVMVLVGLSAELLDYSAYNTGSSFLVIFFVAAQAPVLFSRDLRSGVISLYLARPLGATAFALARWVSLVLAILAFVLTPLLVLFVGGLTAGASLEQELPRVLVALAGAVLLALMLAAVAAVVASWTTRRGLAVGGSIMVLLVGLGVTAAVQAVAVEVGRQTLAQWLALLSPFVLVDSLQVALGDVRTGAFPAPAQDVGTGLALLAAASGLLVLGLLALVRRYHRTGA
jgi:ABC-2 type transport system permease protein